MDYEALLLSGISLSLTNHIAQTLIDDSSRISSFFRFVYHKNPTISWRAAWVMAKVQEKKPELLSPFIPKIIEAVPTLTHPGTKRSFLTILDKTELQDGIPVSLINSCFDWILSPRESIACRALCIRILYKVCRMEPDFIPELRACLENINMNDSKGMRAAARNTLNALNRIKRTQE